MGGERFMQAFKKPFVATAKAMAQQHTYRLCTFGREIGQVHRDQLPSGIRQVAAFLKMRTLGHHVMRQNQRFIANLKYRAIIIKPARARMQREFAQGFDETAFVYDRTSLPMASRMPFTNLASRSSKKAFATSTYSLIAVAVGTSARAINS